MTSRLALAALLLLQTAAKADEAVASASDASEPQAAEVHAKVDRPAAPDGPKAMSGMSILGNEEAPKSLVIIPWKSSELGENVEFSDALDARAAPVDKEVFMRQLEFHSIRAGELDETR